MLPVTVELVQTQSLGAGSPAINTASGCPPPLNDQRGISRPQGVACEIGAFECQSSECQGVLPTLTPTQPGATGTPTPTPTTVAATPTRTPTRISGVIVPTLSLPMLMLLGFALAGAALLILEENLEASRRSLLTPRFGGAFSCPV